MITEADIQDIVTSALGQSITEAQFALLGNFATKEITVSGSDREGLVWCHGLGDDKTSSFVAFKAIEFRNVFGRAVEVVKTRAGYAIVRLAPEDAVFAANNELSSQFPVFREQLMFAGIVPTEPASGSVQLMGAVVRVNNQHYVVNDVVSGDLTDGSTSDTSAAAISLPITEGKAKMVMVQVDPATQTVSYKQTSEFNASFTLAQITPPVPDDGNFLWGYVKLIKGISVLTFENIINVPDVLTLYTGVGTFQTALSGLSLTAVTVASDDKVLIQDTSDSDNLKTVTATQLMGSGGGSPLKMWLFNGTITDYSGTAIEWNNNVIDDTNYWDSGTPEQVLLKEYTGYDYMVEVQGLAYNSGGTSDEILIIYIRHYNSSDVLQSTLSTTEIYIPQDAVGNDGVSWVSFPARVQQNSISSGDYIAIELSDGGSGNVAMEAETLGLKLSEFVTTQGGI